MTVAEHGEGRSVDIEVHLVLRVDDREDYLSKLSVISGLGPYVMDVEGLPDEWRGAA